MQKNGTYEAAYEQRAERYPGLPQDAINEEVAAQYFGVVFSSESNIRKVIENSSQQELSMWQKIVEHLKDFVKRITEAIERYAVEDKTVRAALKADADIIEELARQFDVCLKEAAGNKKAAEQVQGGEKYSISNIGLEDYTKETQNNIKMRKGIIVNSESELMTHIVKALNGKEKLNLHFGAISERVKQKIQKDINAQIFSNKQYTFVVSYDDIRHISEHFVTAEEIANEVLKLYDILSNYDNIKLLIESTGRKKLVLEKTYAAADYRSIEIVSSKTASLDLISVYITKKRSQSVPPATSSVASVGGARLPNNTVPQTAQSVNTNDMQNSSNDTEKASKQMSQSEARDSADIDRMSLKDYNNRGWAYGFINYEDYELLEPLIMKTIGPNAREHVKKLVDGTNVYKINNKIFFIRGSYDDFIIEHLVVLNAENETEFEIITDVFGGIPYENNTLNGLRSWFEGYEAYLGKKYFTQYRKRDYHASSEAEKNNIRGATLPDGFASFGYTRASNRRRGSGQNDNGEISGDIKFSKQITQQTEDNIEQLALENEAVETLVDEARDNIPKLQKRLKWAENMQVPSNRLFANSKVLNEVVLKHNYKHYKYSETEIFEHLEKIVNDENSGTLMSSFTAA